MYSQLLQNLAPESDHRTTDIDYKWWASINGDKAVYQPYEWDEPITVSVEFVVCPSCRGKGKYVNPSIDAHGISAEEFNEDEDFRESYIRGDYDIQCVLCDGEKVIPVPTDPALVKIIDEHANDLAEMRSDMLAEMRAGA